VIVNLWQHSILIPKTSISKFIWQPYTDEVLAGLPSYCTVGRDIWLCSVPLICWHIVEPHCPERVLRQFGLFQAIPPPVDEAEHDRLHRVDRRGKPNMDWSRKHTAYVAKWDDRRGAILHDTHPTDPSTPLPTYMDWFLPRTVIFVDHPARRSTNVDGFQGGGSALEYMVYFSSLNM
jgi:mobile domain-containing protein